MSSDLLVPIPGIAIMVGIGTARGEVGCSSMSSSIGSASVLDAFFFFGGAGAGAGIPNMP